MGPFKAAVENEITLTAEITWNCRAMSIYSILWSEVLSPINIEI